MIKSFYYFSNFTIYWAPNFIAKIKKKETNKSNKLKLNVVENQQYKYESFAFRKSILKVLRIVLSRSSSEIKIKEKIHNE